MKDTVPPPSSIRVRVRVTQDGIRIEIGDEVFTPSIQRALDMANEIERDPGPYGLATLPDETRQIVDALRKAADIHRAYCLGVFKPGSGNAA